MADYRSSINFLFTCLLSCITVLVQAQFCFHIHCVDENKQSIDTFECLITNGQKQSFKTKADSVICQINPIDSYFYIICNGYKDTLIYFRNLSPKKNIFQLQSLTYQSKEVVVGETNGFQKYFRSVDPDQMILGASKKSEIIDLAQLQVQIQNNNARQIYAKIPGLNIWENDQSGLQLNIGARGLSPNRTSNFNTRQDGVDISADALGYPESYYTPPALGIDKIEFIRGAASLQFGSQFGGLLNYKMKNEEPKHILWTGDFSWGSFQFINLFQSLGGRSTNEKIKYYTFYQFKRSDGWRPFSSFQSHNAHASLHWKINEKNNLHISYSHLNYLAQQPGGLTDFQFNQNPTQSLRPRNWFRIFWNIFSAQWEMNINVRLKLKSSFFGLYAGRYSLGNLAPINRPDNGDFRDLIKGNYLNFGNETKLLYRYLIKENPAALLCGVRIYKGNTQQAQGYSNKEATGNARDFEFINPQGILRSSYDFPSTNLSLFAENYFLVLPKLSITPGLRYEFIQTKADGYYQNLVLSPSATGLDTIENTAVYESYQSTRSVFLAGIGISYRPTDQWETYINFSQNYRAINFNDIRIINPNQKIDPNLKDEDGFNADFGLRGTFKNYCSIDASFFALYYNKRIGDLLRSEPDPENPVINQLIKYRTNLGNARVLGLEFLFEWNIKNSFFPQNKNVELSTYINFSILDGRYISSENSSLVGKFLEHVPQLMIRNGIDFQLYKLRLSLQSQFCSDQFSDASNAEFAANAVIGRIPQYYVLDASLSYPWKWFTLKCSFNNITQSKYFTRRASSYPGPGILPADPFNFLISLQVKLASSK
jgi:Fe(3+) dicitrate transport protein